MVDRYSVQSFPYAGNIIDREGMWVKYADYEALEAHIETLVTDKDAVAVEFNDARWNIKELEAKLAALVEATSHAYSEWDGGSHEEAIVAMRQLKAAIAAAKVTP